jgi:acetyl esterase/lipase
MSNIYKQSPYDHEIIQAYQEMYPTGLATSYTSESLLLMRERLSAMDETNDQLSREGKIDVEERKVPGPEGAPDISLLICRPSASLSSTSSPLLPCIYYAHGGGMMLGSNRFGLQPLVDWIVEMKIVVVSVEYRLAPEHPHPALSEDCYAGLLWTVAHAEELGIDLSQVSVAGASAGGGLAAAMALMARDRGGPKLQGQLLFCPMLDDRDQTFSTFQYEKMGRWDRPANLFAWTALLGDKRGTPDVSSYAAPSRAEDLSNLPPAFIDVSSTEIFRDEDIEYAQRIWQAGGVAELHVWPGGLHGFTKLGEKTALSKYALQAGTNWYRRLLASHGK